MNSFIAKLILASMLVISGCSQRNPAVPDYQLLDGTPSSWSMNPDDVVLATEAFCEANSIAVADGTMRVVSHVAADDLRLWGVVYHGIEGPNTIRLFSVDDKTSDVTSIGGID